MREYEWYTTADHRDILERAADKWGVSDQTVAEIMGDTD